MIYPGFETSGNSFLAKSCVLHCDNNSKIILQNSYIAEGVLLEAKHGGKLVIKNSYIGPHAVIVSTNSVEIGEDCMVAEMVVIRDQNHTIEKGKSILSSSLTSAPIKIQQNVWLGAKASVLKGVEIGQKRTKDIETIRIKYQFPKNAKIIGVASRFIHWKGVQDIIKGFQVAREVNPNLLLVLANARGPEKEIILKMLENIPHEKYRLIEFEIDMFSLFHCFDLFIHSPIDTNVEAFGQVYVEAAAAGLPCIFSRSGIANEFFTHEQDCLIIRHQSPEDISNSIQIHQA